MTPTSKLEPPKAVVTFIGCEQAIADHPDVVATIVKAYCQDPHATVRIYVNTRTDNNVPLEWTMRHSSPRGISTFNVVQRVQGGSINFTKI